MSLFRKPKKRMQMRALVVTEDDYDEDRIDVDCGMPQAPPAPIIRPKKEKNSDRFKPKQTLLSFGDEVEEEVFQVKKSSHSKKLAKRLDRERRDERAPDAGLNGGAEAADAPRARGAREDGPPNNSRNNDSYDKPRRPLEGAVLSGRAALSAARGGDVSGSDDEPGAAEPPGRFRHAHVGRSGRAVRALLDSGAIPDAAVIHAARKKRQQARSVIDYIPLGAESGSGVPEPGRLVREDGAGDGSDEDPDRIAVRGVGPPQSRREVINMAVNDNGSDADSGGEEWETQQIRKAVTHSQIMAAQQETYYGNAYVMPAIHQIAEPLTVEREHLRPLAPSGAPFSPQQLAETLQERLLTLRSEQQARQAESASMGAELQRLRERGTSSAGRAPRLAARYEFYQRLRAYLTDLVECLDEKMPALCALEARAMTLHKRKAAFLIERRRADVRDQAQEVMQPAKGRDEERSRRIAEREGRRLRRRRAREQAVPAAQHRDGDSSDDELPQAEILAYQTTQDQILQDAGALFGDTLDEFASLAAVLGRMEQWKRQDRAAYVEAYAGLCLPKLAGPFLRLKLLLWNPIADESAVDWEKMQWYRGLMLYGLSEDEEQQETETSLAADPDITLIPNIIMKIIIPKLTERRGAARASCDASARAAPACSGASRRCTACSPSRRCPRWPWARCSSGTCSPACAAAPRCTGRSSAGRSAAVFPALGTAAPPPCSSSWPAARRSWPP